MTLDQIIEELVSIRLSDPGAGEWKMVAPDDWNGRQADEWYGLSRVEAMPNDQEVRLL